MKTIIRLTFLAALLVGPGMAINLFAAPNPPPAPSAGAPVDAMVGILLILSVVFGLKHLLGKAK
jgi:hypothetical protein